MLVPEYVSCEDFVKQILTFCRQFGSSVTIEAIVQFQRISKDVNLESLCALGVDIVPVASHNHSSRTEYVDKKIISRMNPALRQKDDVCVLLSSDSGYTDYLTALVYAGHKVVLVYQQGKYLPQNPLWHHSATLSSVLGLKSRACVPFNESRCDAEDGECKSKHVCRLCESFDHGEVMCDKNISKMRIVSGSGGDHKKTKRAWGDVTQILKAEPEKREKIIKIQDVCMYFQRGKCKFGDTCKLLHEIINIEKCRDGFFCLKGLECKNHHGSKEIDSFRRNKGVGFEKLFVKACNYGSQCNKRGFCTFSHGPKDSVCILCAGRGSHTADKCPLFPGFGERV